MIERVAALMLGALLLATPAHAEIAVPPLAARVTDLSNTLTPAQRETIERRLADLEQRKGAQVAVLLVPTVAPEAIEQYALRVAETWKLGRKGVDDGVLLLVAKQDRRLRIEVGYGLEGIIPDATAKRIVDDTIIPYFKRDDFFGGVEAGVNQLIRLIDGEALPASPTPGDRTGGALAKLFDLAPILFIGVFIGGGILRAIFGRLIGASLAGGMIGLVAWLMAGGVIAAIAAALAFVLVLAAGTTIGRGGYGGWSSGGSSGTNWGGGGGFSGGGGSFGGGGASGKW